MVCKVNTKCKRVTLKDPST